MRSQVLYRTVHLPCIKFGTAVQQVLHSSRGAPPRRTLLICCFSMLKTNISRSLSVQMANQVAQAQSKAQAALQGLQDQMQQHLAGEHSLV